LVSLGMMDRADARPGIKCHCKKPYFGCDPADSACLGTCVSACIR
jgi:hypothetical protein